MFFLFFFIQWKHIVTMNWEALKRAKHTIKVVCTSGTGVVCFWYIKKRSVTKEKLYQNAVFGPNILVQNSLTVKATLCNFCHSRG